MLRKPRCPTVYCCFFVVCCVLVAYCITVPSAPAQGLVSWARQGLSRKQVITASHRRQSKLVSSLLDCYHVWDAQVGCKRFKEKHKAELDMASSMSSVSTVRSTQGVDAIGCSQLQLQHVAIRVEQATWIPDSLSNLYACRCGLTCLWTKSAVLADKPDALLYETLRPPEEVRLLNLGTELVTLRGTTVVNMTSWQSVNFGRVSVLRSASADSHFECF